MLILFFLLPVIVAEVVFRPGWPGFQNLVDDWANVCSFFIYYLLGFFLVKFNELRQQILKKYPLFLFTGIVLSIVRLIFSSFTSYSWGYNAYSQIFTLLYTVCQICLIIGFLGLAEFKFNKGNALLKKLQTISFPFYILHFIPITISSYFLLKTDLNVYLQFLIVNLISIPVTFLIAFIISRIPGLSISLGIYRKKIKQC